MGWYVVWYGGCGVLFGIRWGMVRRGGGWCGHMVGYMAWGMVWCGGMLWKCGVGVLHTGGRLVQNKDSNLNQSWSKNHAFCILIKPCLSWSCTVWIVRSREHECIQIHLGLEFELSLVLKC